jgi:RNA polymerase sigma-70 factor (ECF subfamily)
MVVRYCRARLSHISGHYQAADDVAQEVCIAVLIALPRYREMGRPFASFVFGIASHKVADAMRSAARLAIPTSDLPDGPDQHPGPEETAVAYLEAERARALLARLSQRSAHPNLFHVRPADPARSDVRIPAPPWQGSARRPRSLTPFHAGAARVVPAAGRATRTGH